MKKQVLCGTDIEALPIALGTADFGAKVSREDAYYMMDKFVDMGGSIIDTALIYSDWIPGERSRSEKTIGGWLKKSGKRSEVIISTKGAHHDIENGNSPRLRREDILGDIEKSLTHLECGVIDIYWLHRDCPDMEVGGVVETLDYIVKSGKARYCGVSNWTAARIAEANRYAEEHGLCRICASQIQYNIADNVPEVEDKTLVAMNDAEYGFYKQTKMPVFAFSAQAKGFFTKLDNMGAEELSKTPYAKYLTDRNKEIYNYLKEVSLDSGVSVNAAAVAELIRTSDFQVVPIAGCRTAEQLEDTMTAMII